MNSSIVIWPGYEEIGNKLSVHLNIPVLPITIRNFPDGESYVRLNQLTVSSQILVVGSLNDPDSKAMALMFLTHKLRERGANKIVLISPYLPYMRQDKEFQEGEYISSIGFAAWLSKLVDHIITIDPHLHRHHRLDSIYTVITQNISAGDLVGRWIVENIDNPLVLGPDAESKQWVKRIGKYAGAPYRVFAKKRLSDHQVMLDTGALSGFENHTPVLIDDIISTGGTMKSAAKLLKLQFKRPLVCIGIHALFSVKTYQQLRESGASQIITTNTIPHLSNQIDITPLLIASLRPLLKVANSSDS